MDLERQGCWAVSPKRTARAKKASWRYLSKIGESGFQIDDPNPELESSDKTAMNSAPVAPNKPSAAALYMAAKNGEVDKLKDLLKGVEDPDIRLLHVAAEEGHKNVVMYFAKQFPHKLNQKDELYRTALHLSVGKKQVAVVQYLANQAHVELDCQDGYHRTPLHIAASTGDLQMVDGLWKLPINLESRDLDGRTPLHYAASDGHAQVVEALTKDRRTGKSKGADPNAKDKRGCTPLHLAAYSKDASRAFQKLLGLPNICCDVGDDDGLTPLHYAAQAGNAQSVSQLLELSLDDKHSISSVWRQTPLHVAAAAGHVGVIRALRERVEHDSNRLTTLAGCSDTIGRTALHYAALNGHEDAVEELLNNWGSSMPSDLDNKDSGGFTALHLAAREGHEKVVQYLIEASANVNVKAGNSTIPEHLWTLALQERVVQGNLMSLDFVQSQGMSALDFAARGGHISVVEELLKSQQRLVTSAGDDAQLSALDWAEINGGLHLFLQHPVNETLSWRTSKLSRSQLKHLQGKWETERQAALVYQLQVDKNKALLPARLSFPRDDHVKSVIHGAASRGDVATLSQLLSLHQVDVNGQDLAGNTPAHLAARNGHVDALKVLLSHPKSCPNKENHWQDTPFRLAFERNHVEACRVLLKLLNDEVEENLGTLLREAIRKDLFEMCTMLVAQKGTRVVDQGRTDGKTPLQLAEEKGSRYVELLLRKKNVRRMLSEERQGFQVTADAILIAATLIAGITYQGWLQPPNPRHNPNPKTPHPKLDSALRCFWWLNSLSFYLAIASGLAGALGLLPTVRTQLTESVAKTKSAVTVACILLILAVLSVMGAFLSAGLVVIWDDSVPILVPASGGNLLSWFLLLCFASRLFRLHRKLTSWDFVNRDHNQEPSTTARLLDFTPVSSGTG